MTTRLYDLQCRGTSRHPGDIKQFLLEPGCPGSFRPAVHGSARAAVDELAAAMRQILRARKPLDGRRSMDDELVWTITIIATPDVKIGPAWRRISYLSVLPEHPDAVSSPFRIRDLKTPEGRAEIARWLDDLVMEAGWLT